jgi:hypothetical protein
VQILDDADLLVDLLLVRLHRLTRRVQLSADRLVPLGNGVSK